MFIRKKKSPHNPDRINIQIVENVRVGKSVSQTVLRQVGVAHNVEELKEMMLLAESIKVRMEEERQPSLPIFNPEDIIKINQEKRKTKIEEELNVNLKNLREEQRLNQGIIEVFGKLYDELKFNEIINGRASEFSNAILKSCVLARVANPQSKSRTAELIENDFGIKMPLDRIYRMMDRLDKVSDRVQEYASKSTLDLLGGKVDILLYDITTLYFESFTQDELRKFGFSKDCKFKEVQVVLVLISTKKGLPIGYKVFPGNTAEVNTLTSSLKALRKQYDVDNVEFAADRALFSDKNFNKLKEEKIKYVIAAKLKNMGKTKKKEILSIKNSDDDKFKIQELEYKGKRLIVTYCPSRAAKDRKDRERLVERLEKKTDKNGTIELKNIINNSGTKKYLQYEDDEKTTATINYEKILEDEKWDGIHGVITNSETITPNEALDKYHNLWVIEESFRISKHDLKLRPIYHRNKFRIKSHLDICYLAYALVRQLMYRVELQYERMSFLKIRNELLAVQASVYKDLSTKKRYIIPSKISIAALKIYQILGLKRSITPSEILKK